MRTIELLNKAIELGVDREKALEYIDASLDEVIGVENRKALAEEEISEELANDILFGFECTIEEIQKGTARAVKVKGYENIQNERCGKNREVISR